ncbi:MAG: double zinc ribbon domain-containing protein, partial [Jannaschia sp.]
MGLKLQRAGPGPGRRIAGIAVATLRDALYPRTCVLCDARVEEAHGLCPDCWSETPFITGAACDLCGRDLPGTADGAADRCDECLTVPRPWDDGRAAMSYAGGARRMVLALKHGDRTELAEAGARWMLR